MVKGKKPRTIMEEDTITFTEPKLPEDLVFTEILSKLPAKSLMRFKCVSKSWSTRISGDSSFIATHLNRHSDTDKQLSIVLGTYKRNIVQGQDGHTAPRQRVSLLSDQRSKATEMDTSYIAGEIFIVGSCNGLVCLQVLKPGESIPRVALWNPATRQLRYVAERRPEEPSVSFFGFGFDDESKDYKIVELVASGVRVGSKSPLNGLVVRAQVFAKSSGRWRGGENEEEGRGVLGLIGIPFSSAVSANGAIHWVAYKRGETSRYCILSFSLRDEVLRVADAPAVGVSCRGFKLCKWKGSLAALEYVSESESRMWMATSGDNDGKKQSLCWRKAFEVDPRVRPGLLRGVWRDQFVVMRHCRRGYKLSLQDQLGHVRKLKGVGPCCFLYGAHDYVESLVSVL